MTKERCKHFEVELEEQSELSMSELLPICEKKIPKAAKHGDIIYTQKFLKSLDVFFLDCIYDINGGLVEKRLTQTDFYETGCCSVPIDVTRKINDPIYFYEGAFKFSDYNDEDFIGIEIDTDLHQELIKRYTGGKTVHRTRKCFYFTTVSEWGDVGMYIWCDFFIEDKGNGRYIKLTGEINEELLGEKPAQRHRP
jgi:hypothetical protein